MKIAVVILIVFWSFGHLKSQTEFNICEPVGTYGVFHHVWSTTDGYLVSGTLIDTIGNAGYKIFSISYSNEGVLQSENYLQDEDGIITSGVNANSVIGDSVFFMANTKGYMDHTECFVMLFNSEGDTINTVHFPSAYYGEDDYNDFLVPTDIVTFEDGSFAVSAQIFSDLTGNDWMVTKFNSDFEMVWQYVYNSPLSYEQCTSLWATTDGGVIGAGGYSPGGHGRVFKLDSMGAEDWYFDNDDVNRGYVYDIIVDQDGIVAAMNFADLSGGIIPCIVKMPFDFNGEYIWTCNSEGDQYDDQWNYHIVEAQGGGYVSLARRRIPQDGFDNWEAWLMKVSATGQLEWERFFNYLEDIGDGLGDYVEHIPHDLKSTSDGGFIFCGEATEHNDDIPGGLSQQGWLVKVDACGCLVPGCDVDCTIGVNETENDARKYFICGPNPVSQYLNVYFFEDNQNAELCIYDMTGKQIEAFVPRTGKTTYMVYVEDYASGSYILNLVVEGQVIQTEKIVVD